MQVSININGRRHGADIEPDMMLLDFLRSRGLKSVKRGCDTTNCGLCTVWMEGQPVLSCSVLAARANGKSITTLEGVEEAAEVFSEFMAAEGAEQCGYCSPGFIMSVLAMEKEFLQKGVIVPSEDEINRYLSGNLCRCTGYMAHIRAISKYLVRHQNSERQEV